MQFKYSTFRLWCVINTLVLCESSWKVCLREPGTLKAISFLEPCGRGCYPLVFCSDHSDETVLTA